MNNWQLKGNWNMLNGKPKQANSASTDDDLAYLEGKEDELMERIVWKTGQTKEQLDKWSKDNNQFSPQSNK